MQCDAILKRMFCFYTCDHVNCETALWEETFYYECRREKVSNLDHNKKNLTFQFSFFLLNPTRALLYATGHNAHRSRSETLIVMLYYQCINTVLVLHALISPFNAKLKTRNPIIDTVRIRVHISIFLF